MTDMAVITSPRTGLVNVEVFGTSARVKSVNGGPSERSYALILAGLAAAFSLRVLGQLVVVVFEPEFLPPNEEWYSGLIPYPFLLPIQIMILGVQCAISRDLWRGKGRFASLRLRFGVWLRRFSVLYFAVMLIRYAAVMILYPERRWFGCTIPIFFHWVLADYLFAYGRYHARGQAKEQSC